MASWITRPSAVFGAGFSRSTTMIVPPGYRTDILYPLGVVLPHYAETGPNDLTRLLTDQAVNFDDGALIFAPTGVHDSYGQDYWKYWDDSAGLDFDFIVNGLVLPAIAAWNVDVTKVFLVGYSNGAFMCHELCKRYSTVFTACFTYSACPLTSDDSLPTTKPVPTVNFHGDADGTVLYAGDPAGSLPGDLNGHGYVSALTTTARHNRWNGGSGTLNAKYDTLAAGSFYSSTPTERYKYSDTTDEHWKGIGATHAIALVANAGEIPWTWMMTNHR